MTGLGVDCGTSPLAIPGGPTMTLSWAAVSHVGHKRQGNEDSYLSRFPIFAVADGMGGHLSGDLASAAVVRRLDEGVPSRFAAPQLIEQALEVASADIDIIAGESELGVGTTVTGTVLTLLDGIPNFAVFNIGDSRVYRFERNSLKQVTVDHSLVQQLVASGKISRSQALKHPDGNIITRAVGFRSQPTPDFWMVRLKPGVRLLICSDGLTGELDDRRLRLHLAAGLSTQETASSLVDAALASGGRDNVTVIVLDVHAAES